VLVDATVSFFGHFSDFFLEEVVFDFGAGLSMPSLVHANDLMQVVSFVTFASQFKRFFCEFLK